MPLVNDDGAVVGECEAWPGGNYQCDRKVFYNDMDVRFNGYRKFHCKTGVLTGKLLYTFWMPNEKEDEKEIPV